MDAPGIGFPPRFLFPLSLPNQKSRPLCRRLSIYLGLSASFICHSLWTRTRWMAEPAQEMASALKLANQLSVTALS
jgi:hypothetical protein